MNATKPVLRLAGMPLNLTLNLTLAAGCLLLSGCREHNEPVKPIAELAAPVATVLN